MVNKRQFFIIMKELTRTQTSTLTGGGWKARWIKQNYKCNMGSARACRRADRIRDRNME